MNLEITIDKFDGPLDLLLTLIKKSNMDINDINILEVTNQYINYIHSQQNLNLNIASDYLLVASELIEIKSKTLLPNPKKESEDEEDPQEKLIERLLQYKKYKDITEEFKKLQDNRNLIHTKAPENLNQYSEEKIILNEDLDITILMEAINKMLERLDYDKPLLTKVTSRELSVKERSNQIITKLKINNKLKFIDLFDCFTKEYIVVTFLSILDMVRKEEIIVIQDNCYDEIVIELRDNNE